MALLSAAVACLAQEKTASRRRVAVLGFKNLRNDENTDWIGAVTAETLTTKLAGVRAMIVIEREQVRKVIQEQNLQATVLVDAKAAVKTGRLLGAQSVVVGSFAVGGGRVRFNARIVDVESGEVLNAATLGGDEADAMDLPVQLADAVIESLSKKVVVAEGQRRVAVGTPPALTDAEKARLAEAPTSSTQAYKAYGRGVDLINKHRWTEARAELEEAVRLDPSFGPAWLDLGYLYYCRDAWPRALQCYETAGASFRAKSDQRNLAWALNGMAGVYEKQGRMDEAMELHGQSLAISRRLGEEVSLATTLGNMAVVHEKRGRHAEAMELHKQALAMMRRLGDEPGVAMGLNNMGNVYFRQGRYAEAMELYRSSLAILRRLGNQRLAALGLLNMANVLCRCRRYAEALPLAREAQQIAHRLGLSEASTCDRLVADLERCTRR